VNLRKLETEVDVRYGTPLRPKPGDFDILEELGDGNFSKIYLAKFKTRTALQQDAKEHAARMRALSSEEKGRLLGNVENAPEPRAEEWEKDAEHAQDRCDDNMPNSDNTEGESAPVGEEKDENRPSDRTYVAASSWMLHAPPGTRILNVVYL
jgi:hypothetical protein